MIVPTDVTAGVASPFGSRCLTRPAVVRFHFPLIEPERGPASGSRKESHAHGMLSRGPDHRIRPGKNFSVNRTGSLFMLNPIITLNGSNESDA